MSVLILLTAVVGCDRPSTPATVSPRTLWFSGYGTDGAPRPAYQNFYEEYEKYPKYAIAVYEVDEPYDATKDLTHLAESVRLCRAHFAAAFRSGTLKRYDDPRPFNPDFVVVALRNRKDHSGESTFDASYRVAWLIPAIKLFDDAISAEELVANTAPDRNPFMHEPMTGGSYFAKQQYHWLIIERHMGATTRPAGAGGP